MASMRWCAASCAKPWPADLFHCGLLPKARTNEIDLPGAACITTHTVTGPPTDGWHRCDHSMRDALATEPLSCESSEPSPAPATASASG